jgi:hypothetical protein
MEDEVEITVIATGFNGGTTDEIKQEVKKNIINEPKPVVQEVESANVEEETHSNSQVSSRVELDDSDIPEFIKKLKSRF